ncbi:serine/threonine dehydratase [Bosea sp. (in: a-proteobacteria)]|uniref:serine/threonine dehydratase n=1 Tax=Bosea sp. (in: a-proteobacteria) TaxID=1871050 RepID=UPI002FC96C98
MNWVAGVDGCKAGWIAAFCDAGFKNPPVIKVFREFASILKDDLTPSIIAVDMPIGLPDWIEGRGRGPEDAARAVLGRRRGSVFSIPSRAAVYAVDRPVVGMGDIAISHAAACGLARATSTLKAGFSRQAFMILPKIREIDRLLQAAPQHRHRIREIHPEVAFWSMNHGRPLRFGKKHPAGEMERIALLRTQGLAEAWMLPAPPKGARRDDQIDALAALVVARHIAAGRGKPFPDPPGRDSHGLPIAIWSFVPDRSAPQESPMPDQPVPRPMIEAAAERIAGHARTTPVMRLGTGAFGSRADVSLKLECLQHAGSFKTRGAFNNLLSLDVPAAGVAAASGGNHGAAVAYAAGKRGVKATIFVPEISPPAKIEAIRRFGAEVRIGGAQYDDAQAACDKFVAETGALKIHPFSAKETVAGQGTLGREWQSQEPDLDTVLVAVGGGGLISGIAAWFSGTHVKVVGVEPEGSRALQAALEAKAPVTVTVASVAADSLGARNVGQLVYDVCEGAVDHVALVPDTAITQAQKVLWRDFRLAVEPGGAAALGALLCGAYKPKPGERLGVLVCGANVDLSRLQEVAG